MFTSLNVISQHRARRLVLFSAFTVALAAPGIAVAQIQFEQAIQDLASENPAVRLKTLQALRDAGYPEAAVPVSNLIIDQQDSIQLQAIATELDLFLADKVTSRKHGDPTVEKRSSLSAEAAFESGPLVVSLRPVPSEVTQRVARRRARRESTGRCRGPVCVRCARLTAGRRPRAPRCSGSAQTTSRRCSRFAAPKLRAGAAQVIGRFYATASVGPARRRVDR